MGSSEVKSRSSRTTGARGGSRTAAAQRQYEPRPVDQAKVVNRPVPKAELKDPREFQVGQIRRRFAPVEKSVQQGTLFILKLTPSDPDFPFDLPFLECNLTVPFSFPAERPVLRVTNKEMPRGFQLNVEKGFDQILTGSPNATLLGVFNRLDKQLENLLSGEKAETVKIMRNTQKPVPSNPPVPKSAPEPQKAQAQPRKTPVETFTSEQKMQAQQKRQAEIRQLVARLGRLPGFNQSSDGIAFTLPFQPMKKAALPSGLQNQKLIRLIVPELYNLHSPRIEVVGNHDSSARALEQSFQTRVKEGASLNLLAHINYLSQNAHTMSVTQLSPEVVSSERPSEDVPKSAIVVPVQAVDAPYTDTDDKPHVQIIPKPPEWQDQDSDNWSSDDDSNSYDSGDETEEELAEQTEGTSASTSGLAERGILLSFPSLEMYGCELLELVSLNITVKCERCKDLLDVQRLRNNTKGDISGMRDEICKKCTNTLAVGKSLSTWASGL